MTNERRRVKVLFVHNGLPTDGHLEYLIESGLDVSDVHADVALEMAITLQPNIIVLDFSADGDTLENLKHNPATKGIPVIALVELLKHQ